MLCSALVFLTLVSCAVQGAPNAVDLRAQDADETTTVEYDDASRTAEETERTWKMNKKGFGYLFVGLVLKSMLLIKAALAKLAILGNISIALSKLSLLLSAFLAFGKYFGGLHKILKLKPGLGYDGHRHPGDIDPSSYGRRESLSGVD